MLSEPGASRSGNSGLVSSAKRRYLKLVHRKIPVSGHRSRTREHKLVHDTHSQLWDVVRRSRGPFTHLCRAERGRKSAKVTLSPAKTTALPFHFWSERKGGFGLPLAWPFAVARATQVFRRNHNQPGTVWRVIALARSDHPTATGESEPSVTLPRTSPPAIVWYQQAPILQSYPTINVTDTSASRAWVHVDQPAPTTALKTSQKVLYRPEEFLGSDGPDRRAVASTVRSRIVTNRHAPCHVTILRFWPAISEPGWTSRKKSTIWGLV
jgi:hypothetical protein